jgi:hypothetical protein
MNPPESPDRLKNLLSILIAIAAVTGALASLQAIRIGGQASSADGMAIAAALDEAATEISIASNVFANETLARELLVHRENGKAIRDEARRNPAIPGRWVDEWQSEMIRARARQTQLNTDFLKNTDGRQVFESERYKAATRAQAAGEKPLDPAPFTVRSEERRADWIFLVALNLFFTTAIFFYTLGLKTDIGRKIAWAGLGAGVYAIGIGLAAWKIFF